MRHEIKVRRAGSLLFFAELHIRGQHLYQFDADGETAEGALRSLSDTLRWLSDAPLYHKNAIASGEAEVIQS